MHQRRAQGGFTLIELMVVVAVVAIISTILFGVSSRTYGANSKNVSDQLVAVLGSARIRAIATRRIHRVIIQPSELQTWASETTGLVDDGDVSDGNDLFVSRETITHGVSIWDVSATVYPSSGNSATENTSLAYEIKFKPDGTSSGGTLFVHDTNNSEYRVLVYRVTGSVYARETW